MRKSLGKMILEAWNLFVDNIVLILPAIGIGILNLIVYGLLSLVLFSLCIKEFLSIGYNFRDPSALPYSEIFGFFAQFIYYIAGIFIISLTYSFIIGVLNRSGWGHMHAKAVTTGKTDIGDYFEGIAKFTGRMFWLIAVRSSIFWIPPLLLLVVAAIAMVAGDAGGGPEAFILVIMGGAVFVVLVEIAIWFYTWMWRPVMFTRDMPVMDALFEGISFTNRRLGYLLLFALLWISVIVGVAMIFTILNTVLQITVKDAGGTAEVVGTIGVLLFGIVRWAVILIMRILFSLFYYKYYFDESTAPGPEPVPAGFPPPYNGYGTEMTPADTGGAPLKPPRESQKEPEPFQPDDGNNDTDESADKDHDGDGNSNSSDPDRPGKNPLPPDFC
ncbi:hypothetical protein ACFLQK_01565 [bacterium]